MAENSGKDMWMEFIHPWGSASISSLFILNKDYSYTRKRVEYVVRK